MIRFFKKKNKKKIGVQLLEVRHALDGSWSNITASKIHAHFVNQAIVMVAASRQMEREKGEKDHSLANVHVTGKETTAWGRWKVMIIMCNGDSKAYTTGSYKA